MSPRYVAARDHSRPRSPITWSTVPGECAPPARPATRAPVPPSRTPGTSATTRPAGATALCATTCYSMARRQNEPPTNAR